MSKNGSTPESVRTLSGSYRLDGKEHSYKVTIHGPTRAEAARVLSDKGRASLRETTRDSCAGQLVVKPDGTKRFGVGKRG